MIGKARLSLCIATLVVFLLACSDKALFQAPQRGGDAAPLPEPADSVVTVVAFLPYKTLADAAEAKMPKSVALGGNGHIACLDVPHVNPGRVGSHEECIDKPYLDFRGAGMERACVNVPDFTGPSIGTDKQCADYNWTANVSKDGPVRIGKSGADIRIEQSIDVTGKAGVNGDLARLLSLNGKNIDVKAWAAANIALTVDKQWCPSVKVVPIGRWIDSATVEVIGRNCLGINLSPLGHPEICAGPVNLGLADVLNNEFDKHRDDIQRSAQSILTCETVRDAVAKQWHPFSLRIDRPSQAPLFLNIEPKTAGFSGLIAEDQAIKIVVRVGAKTVLAPTEIATTVTPLPPLDAAAASQGSLDVNLQAVAPYSFLKDELASILKGKSFKQDVTGGIVEVRINDVDVYPSNGSLTIGLKIDAKTPGSWFNTAGWVYFLGKPRPVEGGKAIVIDDIGFATVVDNEFWKASQSLFSTQILSVLNERARFDLSKEIDKAAFQITTAVAMTKVPGLNIVAGAPSIGLTGIFVASDNLVAVAKLSMSFGVEVTASLLK